MMPMGQYPVSLQFLVDVVLCIFSFFSSKCKTGVRICVAVLMTLKLASWVCTVTSPGDDLEMTLIRRDNI
jgi:hypothetical protein